MALGRNDVDRFEDYFRGRINRNFSDELDWHRREMEESRETARFLVWQGVDHCTFHTGKSAGLEKMTSSIMHMVKADLPCRVSYPTGSSTCQKLRTEIWV